MYVRSCIVLSARLPTPGVVYNDVDDSDDSYYGVSSRHVLLNK